VVALELVDILGIPNSSFAMRLQDGVKVIPLRVFNSSGSISAPFPNVEDGCNSHPSPTGLKMHPSRPSYSLKPKPGWQEAGRGSVTPLMNSSVHPALKIGNRCFAARGVKRRNDRVKGMRNKKAFQSLWLTDY